MAFAGEENDISHSADPQNPKFSHNTHRLEATNQDLRERSLSATVEISSKSSKRNSENAELGNTDEPKEKRRRISKNGRSINSMEPSIGQENWEQLMNRKFNFQTRPRNRRYQRAELESTQSFNPVTIAKNIQLNRETREEYTNYEETSRNGELSSHSVVPARQYRRPLTIDPRNQHINLERNGLGINNDGEPNSNANANIRISTNVDDIGGMGSNRAKRRVTQDSTEQGNPADSDQQGNSENNEFKMESDNKNNYESRSRRLNTRLDRITITNDDLDNDNGNDANKKDKGRNNNDNSNKNKDSEQQLIQNSDKDKNNNNQNGRIRKKKKLKPKPRQDPTTDQMQYRYIRELNQLQNKLEQNARDIQDADARQDERMQGTLKLVGLLGKNITNSFNTLNAAISNNKHDNDNSNSETNIAAKMTAKMMYESVLKPKFEITGQESEVKRLENRRLIEVFRDESRRLLKEKYNDNLTALALYGTLTGTIGETARALTSAYFTSTNKFLRFYDQHCPYSSEAIRKITDMIRRRPRIAMNNKDALLTVISKHNLLKKQHAYAMQQSNEAIEDRMKVSNLEHVQIVYGQLPYQWQTRVKIMNNGVAPRTWDNLAVLISRLYDELQYDADMDRSRDEAQVLAKNAMKYNINKNNTPTGHALGDMVDETPQTQTAFGVNLVDNNPRYNNGRGTRGKYRGSGRGGYRNMYNGNQRNGYNSRGGYNTRGRGRGGYNNRGNRGGYNNRGNNNNGNRDSVKETFADKSGQYLRPFKIGVRIPRVLMNIFKKRNFDQCYMSVLCWQCKRGGHSKWLCAFLHAIRQDWLNMYEVSFQKKLYKPEFNKTAGKGRGFSVNNVNQEDNDDETFHATMGAKSWAAQVGKLAKGSTDNWTSDQKEKFVDRLMDNLGKDKDLNKTKKQ